MYFVCLTWLLAGVCSIFVAGTEHQIGPPCIYDKPRMHNDVWRLFTESIGKIHQTFSLHFCILQVTKNRRWSIKACRWHNQQYLEKNLWTKHGSKHGSRNHKCFPLWWPQWHSLQIPILVSFPNFCLLMQHVLHNLWPIKKKLVRQLILYALFISSCLTRDLQ